MIYRRVLDLTDESEEAQFTAGSLQKHNPDANQVVHHLDSAVPEQMSLFQADDTPDVFKRVRYLSRWEDMPESRGPLVLSTGDLKLWYTSGPGGEPLLQLLSLVNASISSMRALLFAGIPWPCCHYLLSIGFLGTSLKNSRPVIMISSESASIRERLAKLLNNNAETKQFFASRVCFVTTPLKMLKPYFEPMTELVPLIDSIVESAGRYHAQPAQPETWIQQSDRVEPRFLEIELNFVQKYGRVEGVEELRSLEPMQTQIRIVEDSKMPILSTGEWRPDVLSSSGG